MSKGMINLKIRKRVVCIIGTNESCRSRRGGCGGRGGGGGGGAGPPPHNAGTSRRSPALSGTGRPSTTPLRTRASGS